VVANIFGRTANLRMRNVFLSGKLGHTRKMCKSSTNQIIDSEADENEQVQVQRHCNKLSTSGKHGKKMVRMQINGKEIVMALDTGAPFSIINHVEFRKNLPVTPLINTNRRFASYSRQL